MEGNPVKNNFIRAGAYVLFSLGLIVFVVLLLSGIALFLYYPEGSLYKKSIAAGGVLIIALIILLLSIALFESMLELTKVEEAVLELEEKVGREELENGSRKEELINPDNSDV